MGADDWHDPHDLIPEQFRKEFGDSETVADALRRAAGRESTTPDSERRCCPRCYSVCVTPKSDTMSDSTNRRDGAWKCTECWNHFDEPLNMNPQATAFQWTDADNLPDADARERLTPSLDVDRETAVRYAILLRAPWSADDTLCYTEIAAALPYKDSWVGHRVREWRDGEHRDLVPDPTAVEPITVDASSGATAVATDGGRRRRWDAYGSD